MKNNFSRSDVNESTLSISSPNRSSFDLSHRVTLTSQLGRFLPVNIEQLMPSDTLTGSLHPNLSLEKILTPSIGRVRMDTHTFAVSMRRINKDFRSFVEETRADNLKTLPSNDMYAIYGDILSILISQDYTIKGQTWDAESSIASNTSLKGFEIDILAYVISSYHELRNVALQHPDVWTNNLQYMEDFAALEYDRLQQYYSELTASTKGFPLGDFFATIIQPYAGEGSIPDMLGYPILTKYSPVLAKMNEFINDDNPNFAYSTFKAQFKNYKINETFKKICNDNAFSTSLVGTVSPQLCSEMPLRAAYACWYDYMRNYHVEKRDGLLNPDDFDKTSLFSKYDNTHDFGNLEIAMALLVPHFRMFSRDFLTTVQEEDIYRHVYAPVVNSGTGTTYNYQQPNDNDTLDKLYKIVIDSEKSVFPTGFIGSQAKSGGNTSTSFNALKTDLQTLKRTGMLEKWLARNYYYPDNYVGQIQARYGVKPADVAVLTAEYLGGSETFITGEQQVAPVSTPNTAIGTRTLVAGVSNSDAFSYSTTEHAFIISFVSLMPMVVYDSANMHLNELTITDLATPEFADDTRVAISTSDMIRGFDCNNLTGSGNNATRFAPLGYVPRYYSYRVHGDENHGKYLTDYRSYQWFRDWYNMNGKFSLDAYSLRVHLPLDAFLGLNEWDSIAYGSCDVDMFINRPLPAAVEFI